uniref:Acyltransferase C-terminal domain-containing protein n=1 Tax=Sinocyclocheilus rhinocerous TaxID=307959 RepID=A0A673HW31_9TELE
MTMVSLRGLCFLLTLFLGSFFGSVFMLGPVLPLMLLSPAWYRWVTDRIVATWLTLPVVRRSASWDTYFCHIKEPLQLLLFPEGTDLTENTRARSDEFAEKNGLPKYEYVLHPRTTGFTFIVDTLRKGDNLDAVHDITVAYPQNIPQTERHLLLGLFPREIHFHVRRFSAACLPSSAEQLQRWCQERWREKEQRLCAFYRSEPRRFDQPEARVPPCKSQLRVALIKAASLLYWSAFITLCCAGLWLWTPLRLYFLLMVIFFLCQQRVTGGVELMELACHRRWSGAQVKQD